MGLKTETYIGVADAHGIESLHRKEDTTPFDRNSVYFEADLDKSALKVINEYLDDNKYALALEWLKRLSVELRSLPNHEKSWKLIPNVDLDPYK